MTNWLRKRYQGRINRKQFLLPALFFVGLPYAYFALILYIIYLNPYLYTLDEINPLLNLLFISLINIILLPMAVKRLHDIGWSGRSGYFMVIPVINIISTIFLLTKAGGKGGNKYGEVPMCQKKKRYILFWVLLIISFVFIAYAFYLTWEAGPHEPSYHYIE